MTKNDLDLLNEQISQAIREVDDFSCYFTASEMADFQHLQMVSALELCAGTYSLDQFEEFGKLPESEVRQLIELLSESGI